MLATLIRVALDNSERRPPGNQAMLARLAELIFLEAIGEHMRSLPEGSPNWLTGLKDRHVGAALALIHERPADRWTLERLPWASRDPGLPSAFPTMSAKPRCSISPAGGFRSRGN
jgi:hypothetical protein